MEQGNTDHHEDGGKGAALKKFDRSVSLLCWAYNEQDSIMEFLARASRLLDESVRDYEIILIDDGSCDKTARYAYYFNRDHPHSRLKYFRNGRNLNVGLSCRKAIQKASKEFLFWQTVDWAYDISNLREYLELLKTYDIVQGMRPGGFHVAHILKRSDSIGKAVISLVNYWLIRLFYRVSLHDFQNVTFYPTKWAQSIDYEATTSFVNPERLIKSHWAGKTIKEVPIGFMPRRRGKAKGTRLGFVVRSMREVFKFWVKWVVLKRRKR